MQSAEALLVPDWLKVFLQTLAASASILGAIYLGILLLLGQAWIDSNNVLVLTHGIYWLIFPPIIAIVMVLQKKAVGFQSPMIKFVTDDGILIAEPCEWLGFRTSVCVYKMQDDVELLVFSAYVVNIQSNRLVQLQPIPSDSERLDVAMLRSIREKLVIKPGLTT